MVAIDTRKDDARTVVAIPISARILPIVTIVSINVSTSTVRTPAITLGILIHITIIINIIIIVAITIIIFFIIITIIISIGATVITIVAIVITSNVIDLAVVVVCSS